MKKTLLFFLFFFNSLLVKIGCGQLFSQNQHKVDSLKNELIKFEARKRELGTDAPKMIDTFKIKILGRLTTQHLDNFPDTALGYAREQLALSEQLQYKPGIAAASNYIGVILDTKGDYPGALKYYEWSKKMKEEMGDKQGVGDCYANIGVVYSKQANYPEALKNLIKALDIEKELKDSYGIFGCSNDLGMVYKLQNNYPEALKNYFNCLAILKEMKDSSGISVIYNNIGGVYLAQGKIDDAMNYLQRGLKSASIAGDKESIANSYEGIGTVYQEKHDYNAALDNLLKSLKIREEISDESGISDSYIAIGNIYFKQGDNEKAILNITKGLEMAKKIGELEGMKQAYQYLAEIYDSIKDYKLAYENHALYKQVNDSIFNVANQRKFTELEMGYEQAKKDALTKEEEEGQRKIRNYSYLGMGIVVLFLIILIIQRNKIAKERRQKALEQERSRISRELHDDIGAQLSTARMFVSSLKNSKVDGDISEKIDSSLDLLDSSISDLRKIMGDIHSSVLLEKGYMAATEELINKMNQLHSIKFTLSHHSIDKRFSEKVEHQLFRITQELINNSMKYAKAKNVSLELVNRDGKIILMYEDDGIGYDLKNVKRGNGLNNIETRVKSVGGTVEFDSMPGAGARTIIKIPV